MRAPLHDERLISQNSVKRFAVSSSKVIGATEIWSFEFVLSFEFRNSDLGAAMPRCVRLPHVFYFIAPTSLKYLAAPGWSGITLETAFFTEMEAAEGCTLRSWSTLSKMALVIW